MPDKNILQNFLHIYIFLYIDTRRCDFKHDNLADVLQEDISALNDFFSGAVVISLNPSNTYCDIVIQDRKKLLDLGDDYVHLLDILSCFKIEDIKSYIHTHFSGFLKYKLLVFFSIVGEEITKSYYLKQYIAGLDDSLLKDMLNFYYFAFFWDGGTDIKISLSYLDKLISAYPTFVSFRLFKVRQRFELFYRTIIGKKKFNTLVASPSGQKYLQNHSYIASCFHEFAECKKILPDHYVTLLFEGKLLLHLLDSTGVEVLFECLEKQKIAYDTDIFSWIGVYYLQVGDYDAALPYIEISRYPEDDVYKYYTKLIFLYVIAGWKNEFVSLLQFKIPKLEILLYTPGRYFIYKDKNLNEITRPNDINDITKYMSFGIQDFEKFIKQIEYSIEELYEKVFESISRNYYDHWHFEENPKVFFKIG